MTGGEATEVPDGDPKLMMSSTTSICETNNDLVIEDDDHPGSDQEDNRPAGRGEDDEDNLSSPKSDDPKGLADTPSRKMESVESDHEVASSLMETSPAIVITPPRGRGKRGPRGILDSGSNGISNGESDSVYLFSAAPNKTDMTWWQ